MSRTNSRIILCLALFIFNLPAALRADMAVYDSVEWLTSMADQIGVYQAERIHGPHSVTNDPQHWTCCSCTAEFKLQQAVRGNPSPTFSRTRSVEKPEQLGFHVGDTYVFFFVKAERLKNVRSKADSTSEAFFSMWDYLWLERPQGERNGVAIDGRGQVLTNRSEILALVEASLKLPAAHPDIDRWAYFYGGDKSRYTNSADFNFSVITFPTTNTPVEKEAWAGLNTSWTGLVINQGGGSSKTNQPVNRAASH